MLQGSCRGISADDVEPVRFLYAFIAMNKMLLRANAGLVGVSRRLRIRQPARVIKRLALRGRVRSLDGLFSGSSVQNLDDINRLNLRS